ncbi:hypothetical protein HQ32_00945 [Prauserella sp. Am3]|nr:hypothetical protein HQ32_00945 [Prauserella sp. Am3]
MTTTTKGAQHDGTHGHGDRACDRAACRVHNGRMRTWVRIAAAVALLAATAACADEPSTEPAPKPTTSQSPSSAPSAPEPRGGADSGQGCGQRALDKGEFNPDCKEYQGYLDPGGAGREDTAGEAQLEYACEQGYIPKEKC